MKNLSFALTVDRDNTLLQQRTKEVKAARKANQATVPSKLGIEKMTNPFLRWDQSALQVATGHTEPTRTFGKLRGMKDLF